MSESLSLLQYCLGAGAGSLVGFTLGLVGGGGSILAVPLIVYLVGVKDPHLAIGTSAFAVAANAFANLLNHARHGAVKWKIALLFAAAGVVGAAAGAVTGFSVSCTGGSSGTGAKAAVGAAARAPVASMPTSSASVARPLRWAHSVRVAMPTYWPSTKQRS